jgi:polyphosphate kinase 2
MTKRNDHNVKSDGPGAYKKELRRLQIELVKVHRHIIEHGHRVLVIFEGRDAAGKDGTIKRVVEHLSPRETRVVALGKPTDRELGEWYFQRFTSHLPSAGEFVLFNRSWYNRAGVERVMGFSTKREYKSFLKSVVPFELMLIDSGIQLFKYYLDISRKEQKRRLSERAADPLTRWKISPVDETALKHWDDYTNARDAMLEHTHDQHSPWILVSADDKKSARINVLRDLARRIECPNKSKRLVVPDRRILFAYNPTRLKILSH